MHPVWLCMQWPKCIEDTFEKTQWRQVTQMQPMWLCILSGRFFEETFDNSQWRKVNKCDFASQPGKLRRHLKMHSGENLTKSNQWNCVIFYAHTFENIEKYQSKLIMWQRLFSEEILKMTKHCLIHTKVVSTSNEYELYCFL